MSGRQNSVARFAALTLLLTCITCVNGHTLERIHLRAAQKKPAFAGMQSSSAGGYMPYHYGDKLHCSECHVMHASAQHNYTGGNGSEDGTPSFPYQGSPNGKLLKASDSTQLCLTCHDGRTGIPDVVGEDSNGLAERSAGYFESQGVSNYRGHNLGTGLSSDPNDLCNRCHFSGSFATATVACIDCHASHGNGNPRNLQWASWPGYEPTFGLLMNPSASGMQKYERTNVAYGTLNSDLMREVTNMCIDCHHVFSGQYYIDPDGNGIHERHPTYESERGSPNFIAQGEAKESTNPAHWLTGSGSGFTGTARVPFVVSGAADFAGAMVVDAHTNGVFCLSCHKAHGGRHGFSLTWPTEGGSGAMGCNQCHAIAG